MTTTKNTQTFDAIFQEMKVHGMKLPSDKVYLNVPDSRRLLFSAIRYFVSLEKKEAVWLPEYEKVASWLNDNGGRGLFLYGTCGRGKSILCRYALPAILLKYAGRVVSVFDIQDMNKDIDLLLSKHVISLDDIGTEEVSIKYGERRMAFAEVMDSAEKHGKLVIVSTNLNERDLRERYGDRVLDRIKATTTRVKFVGESLRK